MLLRAAAAALFLLALAGCDTLRSDQGSFEATLTEADGTAEVLEGSAVYDVQDGGATVLLLPRTFGLASEIRVQIAREVLAEGIAAVGDGVSLAYVVRNRGIPIGTDPNAPGAQQPNEGGALVYNGDAGTVTLARVSDRGAEGRIAATIRTERGDPVALEATFRAVLP